MEAYTFIHKETKEVIRIDYFSDYNEDFGQIYYLTHLSNGVPWFVFSLDEIKYVLENSEFMHPINNNSNSPSAEHVNLNDYEIRKFVMNENI